ncbi:LysM peptidoglycan-binding domain-containing protein [Corallococcus terminator]|uniref:LysM domain-containing protein n=1 Tax=Corallococcus terminator TaxID=2316733 RepID=A0A3A8JRY6_9BACT|nr:LysM domain-containing protein [Corallococcus terminator]RKG93211.1 LysM domain-containing protein [Corallococcus terminator]
MSDPSSRNKDQPMYAVPLGAGGATVSLYMPRVAPRQATALLHKVAAGDRLDLLAQRYFSDPFQAWRIVDANPTFVPESLLEPGTVLFIPEKP